jgi:predicted SAM-dependent methyltransferase
VRKANIVAPDVKEGVHLNIGCGAKLWNGFVNIDFPGNWSGRKPDIECDVRELNLPDDYADSAYAIHVFEHFYRWEAEIVLKEWKRVIKPGGQLILELPCLDKVIGVFIRAIEGNTPITDQATMWRLYGDPYYKDPHMVHRWCYPVAELIGLMEEAGFKDVHYAEPKYHVPACDMRVVGTK